MQDQDEDQRLYGRRRGRRLRRGRQALLDERLPEIEVRLPEGDAPLDPATLFPFRPREVWLEIGFGAGEHLVWQADRNQQVGVIGCEPYLAGVGRLLAHIAERPRPNVRILADDARPLLARLQPASLGRVFILFPDPWPKARHHKRRLIAVATIDRLAVVMRAGAELRLATDDAEYLRWMLERLLAHVAFEWLARGPDDWRSRPADWPPTRYEEKAIAQGRRPAYLRFRRR